LSLVGNLRRDVLAALPINNLTLMAPTIATGFVVRRDATAALVHPSSERGETLPNAALAAPSRLALYLASLDPLADRAVASWLLFMWPSDYSVSLTTLAVAILISGGVTLTLTPMMCARSAEGETRNNKAASTAPLARIDAIARYGVY
jgi:multidrug efflux pump